MRTSAPSISIGKVGLYVLMLNLPLFAFSFYVHALLAQHDGTAGNFLIENIGIWILIIFKILGGNLFLAIIFSDFKIK